MKVAVTGATGNVGYSVSRALLADERVDEVVGIARRRPSAAPYDDRRFHWYSADVADDDLSEAFDGVDAVIHLAWMFHPTRHPTTTWHGNVRGAWRVATAAADAGAGALIYASSVGAYAPGSTASQRSTSNVHADGRPIVDEDHPTDAIPTAAYGAQKSHVERLLDLVEVAYPATRVIRIRSAFVFQKPASPEQRRIFAGPFLPGQLIGNRRLPIVPVPAGLSFQAVHADDLAQAYLAALHSEARGPFNIAGAGVVDIPALRSVLDARTVEVPPAIVRSALAAAYRARLAAAEPGLFDLFISLPLMDTSRARHELGWQPKHTGLDAVAAFLEGLADPDGAPTPPLASDAGGPARLGELATGVGGRG